MDGAETQAAGQGRHGDGHGGRGGARSRSGRDVVRKAAAVADVDVVAVAGADAAIAAETVAVETVAVEAVAGSATRRRGRQHPAVAAGRRQQSPQTRAHASRARGAVAACGGVRVGGGGEHIAQHLLVRGVEAREVEGRCGPVVRVHGAQAGDNTGVRALEEFGQVELRKRPRLVVERAGAL
mgnify:CR=1 FL=1